MKKLNTLLSLVALLSLFGLTAGGANAQTSQTSGAASSGNSSTPDKAALATDLTDGEVRKVDSDNQKITLRHGEIKNLDMPGMTMVFQVKDPALLNKVKAGDKIRFRAERSNGAIVVTVIETAK